MSIEEDHIYKKHHDNLCELDRVTKKMQNYLLTDEFEDSIGKNKLPYNQQTPTYHDHNEFKTRTGSNSLVNTHSSLGRENEHI